MVGIIVVSHGTMAEGMLNAAGMIVGPLDDILPVSLKEADAVEDLMGRIAQAVDQVDSGDGVLILVDAFGASPFNAGARLALARPKIEVISGMNLPMLMELAISREGMNLDELVKIALEAGTTSIRTLSQSLKSE